jgi:hypothetical protein
MTVTMVTAGLPSLLEIGRNSCPSPRAIGGDRTHDLWVMRHGPYHSRPKMRISGNFNLNVHHIYSTFLCISNKAHCWSNVTCEVPNWNCYQISKVLHVPRLIIGEIWSFITGKIRRKSENFIFDSLLHVTSVNYIIINM